MDEATKSLVVGVMETLKDFAAGKLSTEDCRRRYRQMISDCESMELVADRSTGLMQSLCYAHSTGNFALFTGIYRMQNDSLTPLSFCGDGAFNVSIAKLHHTISSRVSVGRSVSMLPGDAHPLPHTVYTCLVPGESRIRLIFAAISSSHFFSENEFVKTANVVGALRDAADFEMNPQYFSFFSERRTDVSEWISARIDEGLSVYVHYFLFNMVERIFSHMGLPEMLKISASIKDALHAQCGTSGTVVFELSMREYLVFIPDSTGTGCEKKKASFDYHGSSIPSQSYAFTIRKHADIIDFWNEVLEFEYGLAAGEKRK